MFRVVYHTVDLSTSNRAMLEGHRALHTFAAREQYRHADLLTMFCSNKHQSAQSATRCAASLWQILVVTHQFVRNSTLFSERGVLLTISLQ